MPIYEYQCKKCSTQFEVLQKFNDAKPKCEECGSRAVTKLVSQTSFVLKGEGWYVTDYAQKDKKAKEKREKIKKEGTSKDTDASSKKTESKKSEKKSSGAKKKKKKSVG